MRITITKGEKDDRIEARRPDGSEVATTFPHKGSIPHDATHFIVESELAIADGFWGLVASGRHPEEIAGLAKAAGHASAKRAATPDESMVPIIQAERVVECFEADLWSGGNGDPELLLGMIAAGCEQSLVPTIPISGDAIGMIRIGLAQLRERWTALPQGDSLTFDWVVAR